MSYNSLFFHLKLWVGYCVWKNFVGFCIHFSCLVEVSSLMKTPFCRQHNLKLNFVLVIESNFFTFVPKVGILSSFIILKFCSFQLNLYFKKQLSCRGWYMKNAREAHFILMKHQMLWSRTRPVFICGQTNCSYQQSKMAKVIMREEWFQNWQACLEFPIFLSFHFAEWSQLSVKIMRKFDIHHCMVNCFIGLR